MTVNNGLQELATLLANTASESKEWRPYIDVDNEMLEELKNKLQVPDKALLMIALFMGMEDNKPQTDWNAILQEVIAYVDSNEELLHDDFGREGNITLFYIKRCVQEVMRLYPTLDARSFIVVFNKLVPAPYDSMKHADIALGYYNKFVKEKTNEPKIAKENTSEPITKNPFDVLAEEAMEEYESGQTIDLETYAKNMK